MPSSAAQRAMAQTSGLGGGSRADPVRSTSSLESHARRHAPENANPPTTPHHAPPCNATSARNGQSCAGSQQQPQDDSSWRSWKQGNTRTHAHTPQTQIAMSPVRTATTHVLPHPPRVLHSHERNGTTRTCAYTGPAGSRHAHWATRDYAGTRRRRRHAHIGRPVHRAPMRARGPLARLGEGVFIVQAVSHEPLGPLPNPLKQQSLRPGTRRPTRMQHPAFKAVPQAAFRV